MGATHPVNNMANAPADAQPISFLIIILLFLFSCQFIDLLPRTAVVLRNGSFPVKTEYPLSPVVKNEPKLPHGRAQITRPML
jgi:hypothetical protein